MGLDPTTFDFAFKHTGKLEGNSALRYTYYPKADPTKVKPGQLRCAEHTDLGIITMLYQDELGGLEFLSAEGKYVPAVPIKGSICINIGNMMQKLTSDRLIAGNLSPGIRNLSPGIWNPSPGIQNPSPGIRNPSPGIWNPSPGIRNSQHRIQNPRLSWIPLHGAKLYSIH
ncbi:unnamed protein product [Porites evermanni]|uniref:Isopenicillin N synthase-like Fe(2+) 2OG dioxygenase domain-containing protein n=1 Tax=Porites evermanni TaxID=104178 RepID=A0ABN8SGW6_9CNID|nr:unnamed protein product [Porites evermanni]